MKKYLILSFTLFTVLFMACEEDSRGPLLDDGIPPGPVSNVQVENIAGGATLTYQLPTDNDALYVLAEYTLNSGKSASVKSTVYKNNLNVVGFGDTNAKTIKLYAVDRGENLSDPVEVTINPLTPAVTTIREELIILPDFGGIHLFWENETEAEVAVIVWTPDSLGTLQQIDIRYSSLLSDHFAIRGYDTEPREFVVTLRDRWDNFSEPLTVTVSPLFEEQLDKDKFTFLALPHDAPSAWGWVGPRLIDNNIGSGYHSGQGYADPDPLPNYDDIVHMITIDLGVTAKLSRFKFWQRQGSWIFRHGNPHFFDIWGAKTLDPSGTLDGWTKLIENGEVLKPSGLPPGQFSNADKEQAAAGEEFPFALDSEPVRYIRFVSLESWSGAKFIHMMEMDFWGQIEN